MSPASTRGVAGSQLGSIIRKQATFFYGRWPGRFHPMTLIAIIYGFLMALQSVWGAFVTNLFELLGISEL
jgi:hypothetical protein